MTRVLLDAAGITVQGDSAVYSAALGYGARESIAEPERVRVLASLIRGAGITILTGPESAPFWSCVSPEVRIQVVPDNYEYVERLAASLEWAARAVGINPAAVRQLLNRKTEVPATHRFYDLWTRAKELLADLEACGECEPLIDEEFRTEQWSVEDAEQYLASTDDLVALDYEWDTETAEPVGLAIGTADRAAYVPVRAADLDRRGEAGRLHAMVDGFLRRGGSGLLHGGRADLGTQYSGNPLDLVGSEIDDTMVMAYLCGEPVLALKDLAHKLLGRDATHFPGNLSELPVALGTRYAAADGRNTYDLYAKLGATMAERGQWGVYTNIERPLIPVIVSMEREGVPLDIDEVRRQYRDAVTLEMGMRYAIRDLYGFDVAKDSGTSLETNQARQFVASVRGIDPGTTDQRVLTMFPEGEIDLLLFHRRQRTLRRNFLGRALRYMYAATHPGHERHLFKSRSRFTKKGKLTDLGQYLDWKRKWEATDRVQFRYFPRFNQAGSVDGDNHSAPRSGRLSSSDPNFTNQPRGDLRRCYVPPPGCDWWSFDYSGLELHIAAALSNDATMTRVLGEACPDGRCTHFPKHGDLHSVLQAKVKELTGRMMDRALVVKPFNFEQLYGGGAAKGVEIVAKSRTYIQVEDAKLIIEAHKAQFAGYWEWAEERHAFHIRHGYGETLFGRRRYEPEVHSRDGERQAYALRALLNHEIQGSGADIVKRVMGLIVPVLRAYVAHMCAQVHDEIDGWLNHASNHVEFKEQIEDIMTSIALPNGVKLKVEGGFGPSWGLAH